MSVRLHLRRIRVVSVLVDLIERLVVEIIDSRRMVRCPHCRSECDERHWETHPEIIIGRRTHVTRRLARQLVKDVSAVSIREVSRRTGLSWHFIMALTRDWAGLVTAARRSGRCRVLLVDETSLRRGHRHVTMLINGDTGQTLNIIKHRAANALKGFLKAQGHRWCRAATAPVK